MNHPVRQRAGFSLIEMLMALFILGIGVISVAALLPAGIYQQRQSVDDVLGPAVADNAIAYLRTRVQPEDFGHFSTGVLPDGDWGWMRPAFIFAGADARFPLGGVDLFNGEGIATAFDTISPADFPGIPSTWGLTPPSRVIPQEDRYYPLGARVPQYVWECMFRRFEGRIQVAIFVYRVTRGGGEPAPYAVVPNPSNPTIPPVPIDMDLVAAGFPAWNTWGILLPDSGDDASVVGTEPGTPFDLTSDVFAWQASGQWILDANNNVHRVLGGREVMDDGPVTLVRPPSQVLPVPGFVLPAGAADANGDGIPDTSIVGRIFYMPLQDSTGVRLTPVYLAVKEL